MKDLLRAFPMSNNLLWIGLIYASKDAYFFVIVPSYGYLCLRSTIVLNFQVDSYAIIHSIMER